MGWWAWFGIVAALVIVFTLGFLVGAVWAENNKMDEEQQAHGLRVLPDDDEPPGFDDETFWRGR